MPVVAVVGGVMSASAGLGAIAAAGGVAAMGAASIGSLVVAGLQVVGGVASALGAITGNEKLMKVGMVASLGASAVSAVSSLGSASSSAGSIMDGATGVAKNAPPSYADFAAQTSGGGTQLLANVDNAANALTSSSVADIAGSVASNTPLTDALAVTAPSSSSGLLGSAARAASAGDLAMTPPTRASDFAGGGDFKGATEALRAPTGQMNLSGSGTGAVQGENTNIFRKGLGFVKDNPELMKTGMGMLSDLGRAYQADATAKRAERIDAEKRNRLNTSISALQASYR